MQVWRVLYQTYKNIMHDITIIIEGVLLLTISSSLHRLSSSSDIRFSCFLKYLRLDACRLNHVYENAFTLGNNASMNGWNSSCGKKKKKTNENIIQENTYKYTPRLSFVLAIQRRNMIVYRVTYLLCTSGFQLGLLIGAFNSQAMNRTWIN